MTATGGTVSAVVHHGDCLEFLRTLPDGSVDAVVTDPPYGTTNACWDVEACSADWWSEVRRLLRHPKCPVVLTACGMFTFSVVKSSQIPFRYKWVWCRGGKSSGFLDAASRPMRCHEDVLVFADSMPTYNPQKWIGDKVTATPSKVSSVLYGKKAANSAYSTDQRYPIDVVSFNSDDARVREHPTQKPVALMEYMVRTYTDEGGTVLDPFAGSGTTGVAALRMGRNFIGCEIDAGYCEIARRRIAEAQESVGLFVPKPAAAEQGILIAE